MYLKLVFLIATISIVAAIELHQPLLIKSQHLEEEGPAEYDFSYAVHDEHTGDIKSQKESRKGHKVEGVYTLIEPDGHRRIVEYRADHHTGFEAIVHREPTNIKIPVPEAHGKLIATKIIAPLGHLDSHYGSSHGLGQY